jgi:hypothetical protein
MSEAVITSLSIVFFLSFIFLLPSFAIPYLVLRLRDSRNEKQDPQLGLKAALYFLFSVGVLLFLYGLTTLVVDLLLDRQFFRPRVIGGVPGAPAAQKGLTPMQRIALALIIAGVVVSLLHLGLVKLITDDRALPARRMFAGWRLVIHSIVIVTTFTTLMILLLLKVEGANGEKVLTELRKMMFGVLLVWIPSWVLHLVLLWFYSKPLFVPVRAVDTWDSR